MSSTTYHKVSNLPFYSLQQFTQLQTYSIGNNSIINLYKHNQSQQVFVVKQVPYCQEKIRIYQIIIGMNQFDSLVRIRGVCKMVVKFDRLQSMKKKNKRNCQISQNSLCFQSNSSNSYHDFNFKRQRYEKVNKQKQWLLIFMQKCSENLNDFIKRRRKERKLFKCQQIIIFINQILVLLQSLQKLNISHRDIKPQNFLYDKGKFKLCDFQNSIYWDPQLPLDKRKQLDITTVEYTTPQFFKNLRAPKNKIFDPYKLDLYAFGITILYMCSMGQFSLSQRRQYLQEDSIFHNNFMKQQRRRYLKNNNQFKSLNTVVKMMLEQDQYKRDNFQTFMLKTKSIMNLRQLDINVIEEQAMSDNYKSEQSITKLKKAYKKNKWANSQKSTQMHKKTLKSLLTLGLAFFILILII